MKKLVFLSGFAGILLIAASCAKDDSTDNPSSTPGPKFLAAQSVITSSCALSGCHVSPSNKGGLNFETNENIVAAGAQIYSISVVNSIMPPTAPLSAENKAKIAAWINAGGKLTD